MRFFVVVLIVVAVVAGKDQCPGGLECPKTDGTCCQLKSGKYSCCPLSGAVCCQDGFYCCPAGTKCNLESGTCDQAMVGTGPANTTEDNYKVNSVRWMIERFDKKQGPKDQLCPGGKKHCDDQATCCKTEKGYGCCPYADASCCSDNVHCCPAGMTCDVEQGTCNQKQIKVKLGGINSNRNPVKKRLLDDSKMVKFGSKFQVPRSNLSAVVCPGGSLQCPDSNTCCKLKDGEWGCCPLPNAVCCEDQVHCCPDGFSCNTSGCKRN